MESDQTSDADKAGQISDPSDNNPEMPTAPLDPNNNEEVGNLGQPIQDVSMSAGESDKGREDPGKSDLLKFGDIVKQFFETTPDKRQGNVPSYVPDQQEKELISKLDFSFSIIKASDYGPTSSPADDSMSNFYDSYIRSPTKRKPDSKSCMDSETSKAYLRSALEAHFQPETGDSRAKPASPTNAKTKRWIPKPIAVTVCNPRVPTPYYDKYRELSMMGADVPDDIRKKAKKELKLLEKIQEMESKKQTFVDELGRRADGMGMIENALQPAFGVNIPEPPRTGQGSIRTVKDLVDSVVVKQLLKSPEGKKSEVPTENPFGTSDPPAPLDNKDIALYCDKDCLAAGVYPSSPSANSLDEDDYDHDDSLLSLSDDEDQNLPPSVGSDSLDDYMDTSSGCEDAGGDVGNIPGLDVSSIPAVAVEDIYVDPSAPSKSMSSICADFFDRVKDLPADGRTCKNMMEKSLERKEEADVKTDDDSPKYVLNKVPLSMDSTFSSADESNYGSPVLKTHSRHSGGKRGEVQKSSNAPSSGNEVKVESKELAGIKRPASVILESPKKRKMPEGTGSLEVPSSTEGIPVSFSNPDIRAWVKGKMSFTPKNLQELEEEVIKTISSIQISSSNPDVLNRSEIERISLEVELGNYSKVPKDLKKPVERKDDGKPMDQDDSRSVLKYLEATKRRIEDNLMHLKLLINHVDHNLGCSKDYSKKDAEDSMDTGGIVADDSKEIDTPDKKDRKIIEGSKETGRKSPCSEEKHTDDNLSEKENNFERDSKSKITGKRLSSPLSDLNQDFQPYKGKRSLSLSPTFDEQKTKARKTYHRKSQTP